MSEELPPHELNTLLLTATEAADLATSGEVLNGYRCLLAGLERAEAAERAGEPWGPALVAGYRKVLLRYGLTWRVSLE